MAKIGFSKNWNKKLDCEYFTTIRLESSKYKKGELFDIELHQIPLGKAEVVSTKTIYLDKLDEMTAALDSGLTLQEAKEKFYSMYPTINFLYKPVVIILLKYVKV